MHIRKLHIQNFRAVRLQELLFEDAMGCVRPVTVLAGPNGCGKTSVLLAIYRALSGAMGYHSDDVPDPSDNEIYREGGSAGWSFQPNRTVVALDLEYRQAELEAITHVFEATRRIQKARPDGRFLSPPSLEQGRMTVEWGYPPELRSDGTPNSTAYLRATPPGGPTLLAGPKYAIRGWRKRPNPFVLRKDLDEIGILRMFAQNRGKRWVAGEESEAFPADGDAGSEGVDTERSRRRPDATVAGILKVLADAAAGRRLPDNGVEDLEERVRESFGRICAPKRYVGYVYFGATEPVGTPLMQEGERQYPLEMGATGEQVVLDYLTQFVYPRPVNNSIVLIDEPELHLHPRWIRQLYRALPLMGRNNQFIMTTHSPELRQLAAEDNALIDMGNLDPPARSATHA